MVANLSTEKISVIIPAFNAEAYLKEAIESVFNQNYPELEVLVINDGSTDGTDRIARSFGNRIRYFSQSNSGPPVARNRGLTEARGSFIGFLDADDLWAPDKLKCQLAAFREDTDLHVVLGKLQRFICGNGKEKNNRNSHLPESWMAFSLGTGLFKKSVFDQVGLLDKSMRYSDDIDWFLRFKEAKLNLKVMDRVVLFYRRHSKNMTLDQVQDRQFYLKAIKNSLRRRKSH